MSEIVYNWNFNPLEIVYNEEGMVDVIQTVHWQYSAKYELNPTSSIVQQSIGTVSLPTPHVASFTPFTDVTKEMVTDWVVTALGTGSVESMQQSLSSSIAYDLAPTKGTVSPPWV
jgi:hypothetical protein